MHVVDQEKGQVGHKPLVEPVEIQDQHFRVVMVKIIDMDEVDEVDDIFEADEVGVGVHL